MGFNMCIYEGQKGNIEQSQIFGLNRLGCPQIGWFNHFMLRWLLFWFSFTDLKFTAHEITPHPGHPQGLSPIINANPWVHRHS